MRPPVAALGAGESRATVADSGWAHETNRQEGFRADEAQRSPAGSMLPATRCVTGACYTEDARPRARYSPRARATNPCAFPRMQLARSCAFPRMQITRFVCNDSRHRQCARPGPRCHATRPGTLEMAAAVGARDAEILPGDVPSLVLAAAARAVTRRGLLGSVPASRIAHVERLLVLGVLGPVQDAVAVAVDAIEQRRRIARRA